YVYGQDWCVAPEDAHCVQIETGAWGCVFPSNGYHGMKKKKAAHAESCTEVSVEGDATYCIQGAVCGDEGDACPTAGTEASSSCRTNLLSYVDGRDWCVAPEDAKCVQIKTGAWGCVYPSQGPQKRTHIRSARGHSA
ncbi:hypothetical protein ACHHYP_14989, partial [Achlya hypogyna]